MGSGSYTSSSFRDYAVKCSYTTATSSKGHVVLDSNYTAQDLFKSRRLNESLNPKRVLRECCDSNEHPNTIPVILALDVTGSMGSAAAEVAKKLSEIMGELYQSVTDVEFMTMGIGDLAYDDAPIQASQFESDIRINEQLDKVYFEGGGGGNGFESYTAAWYFGLNNTKLDCWKRGKKGIIITLGDEPLNPYLPKRELNLALGSNAEADVETEDLYKNVTEKFDVYHIAVDNPNTSYKFYANKIKKSFGEYLDDNHLKVVTLDGLAGEITNIILESSEGSVTTTEESSKTTLNENGEVVW